MVNTADTDTARILGNLAFARGVKCAPCLDGDFMARLTDRKVGDQRTVSEMKAWLAGWHECNAAGVA